MSNQVLQWQKQHQSDLKMLAAKEEQLRAFQEEMATLKENLLADEKEVGTPQLLVTSSQTSQPIHNHLDTRPTLVGVGVPKSKEMIPLAHSIQYKVGSGCSKAHSSFLNPTIFLCLH